MNRLLQVTGQVQAALASLAEDQPDVQNTLAKLPQVVVVGSQSAGKSTLLESFISEKFLPTGPDMVTRRPIIISLVTAPNVNFPVKTFQDPKAPGVPASTPIVDPEEVRKYLIMENKAFKQMPGHNPAGISAQPIRLTIAGRDLPTLTIVDLPGIINGFTAYPSVVDDIKELVAKYVTDKPNVLMLAVIAAKEDLNLAHALPVANRADPSGMRTIEVYTKMDDAQPYAWKALHQAGTAGKPGSVGVKLKPEANQVNSSLPEALWHEQQWFAENTPSGMQGLQNVGVHYLLWRVQDWLIPQINNNLAGLKEDIRIRLDDARVELGRMSALADLSEPTKVGREIEDLSSKVDSEFQVLMKGQGGNEYRELVDSYTHTEMFTGLDELLQFDNAAKIIKNAEGANRAIAPDQWSDAGCRELAKQAASSFLGPAVQHLEKIESLLVMWSDKAVDRVKKLSSFESLKDKMKTAAAAAIHARQLQATEDVTVLIAKHEALLDEEALSEMRAAADEKQAESVAAKGGSPEHLVRVSLVPKKEGSPLPPTKAQILANQKAKADYNVRVTSQVVNDYIKDAVQARLAFDIPSSWRLFMLQGHPSTGLLKRERSDGSNEPDCMVQQCWDMVDLQKGGTSKKALAAAAQLRALVEETHDKAELRKRLTDKVKAFTQALEGLEAVVAVPPPGPYVKMDQPASLSPTTLPAVQPQTPSVPGMSQEEAQSLLVKEAVAVMEQQLEEERQQLRVEREAAEQRWPQLQLTLQAAALAEDLARMQAELEQAQMDNQTRELQQALKEKEDAQCQLAARERAEADLKQQLKDSQESQRREADLRREMQEERAKWQLEQAERKAEREQAQQAKQAELEAKEVEWRQASEAKAEQLRQAQLAREEDLRQSHLRAQQAKDDEWERLLRKTQLEASEQSKTNSFPCMGLTGMALGRKKKSNVLPLPADQPARVEVQPRPAAAAKGAQADSGSSHVAAGEFDLISALNGRSSRDTVIRANPVSNKIILPHIEPTSFLPDLNV